MSRYVNDLTTKKKGNDVIRTVTDYMAKEGFRKISQNGEEVWKKGFGLLLGPQFLKIEPLDKKIHIEGWIKFAILPGVYVGEMGTEGFIGVIPKRKLKTRVEQIEKMLV